MGEHGARISTKLARVSVVCLPAQIPDSFASLVASNRGLTIRPVTDREKAVAWHLGRPS